MDSRLYWEDNGPHVKYESYNSNDGFGRQGEGNLNFATGVLHSEDDGDYISTAYLKKGKVARQDPMSHRIIEKRRRDRMNNCLADLSRLIPPDYLKKGRGRVEKTEIIEMAIRHLKYLQDRTNDQQCEGPISAEHFRLGYQECRSEVMRYLVEGQGYLPTDSLCVQLVGHLHRHCDNIMKGDQLNKPRSNPETTSSSSGSSNNNYSGVVKQTVIAQAQRANPLEHNNNLDFRKRQHYEPQSYAPSPEPQDDYMPYQQCEPQPLTLARNSQSCEPTLRNIRKLEHSHVEEYADHIHSYKYKNTIKQRFSQDIAQDMSLRHGKRCRASSKQASSISLTSNDEGVCQDASSEESPATDELRDIPPHLTPEPPPLPTLAQVSSDPPRESKLSTLCIPVFALNAHGKYYVPLNVNYECLASFLGPYDLLDGTNGSPISPLHPVSINVNFQPYLEHIKLKPESKQDWHPI